MKIQGFAAYSARRALEPFSYEAPKLKDYELLIKISHSGLCYTDLYMIDNDWRRSTYPLLPGHEVVGTVLKKGPLAKTALGERVGVSWVKSSCLVCPLCLQGETNICPTKISAYNNGSYGGFADYMIADSRFVYPIPDGLDSALAAPLLCAGATMYTPFRRFGITAAHHIAILGIGGLGHLGLQFARAFGCETTAISSSPSKEKEAKKFGADHFFSLDTLPDTPLFDFLLCTADFALDINQLLSLLQPNGTLIFVSRPSKGAALDFSYLVSTQRKIVGSNNANRFYMNEMLAFAARQKVAPQIEKMPLSEINQAIERLRANRVRYRIVLENPIR